MKEVNTYQAANQQGILLNANELPDNVSKTIVAEIQEAIPEILFNRYPDDSCKQIRQAYADVMGLESEQLLAGNGSDQVIGLVIGTFLGHGKTLFTLDPDFSMYDYYASSYEAQVKKYPFDLEKPFDVKYFIEKALEAKPDMILFSNPNNPSGKMLTTDEIKMILETFDEIPVVIDEAYMDFANESMLPYLEDYDNLYVTRTLSKAFGAAGLRLGFLASSKKNIAALQPKKIVYALNSVSMKIGTILLQHAEEYKEKVEDITRRRDEFYDFCLSCSSLHPHPSAANFIMIELEAPEVLNSMLQKEGIAIRCYPQKNYVRINMGTEEEMQACKQVIREYEEQYGKNSQ